MKERFELAIGALASMFRAECIEGVCVVGRKGSKVHVCVRRLRAAGWPRHGTVFLYGWEGVVIC